jgi:acetyl-CoA synthetase
MKGETERFLGARDFLRQRREDYEGAYAGFRWPDLDEFNWALDYFDVYAEGNRRPALWIVDDAGREWKLSFADMRERSSRVASFLRQKGLGRGGRILLMLDNQPELWETIVAAMKLGAVLIPSSLLLTKSDLQDRIRRGEVALVVTTPENTGKFEGLEGRFLKVVVGGKADGWISYDEAYGAPADFRPGFVSKTSDPLFLYFTSGTTALPKMVLHTHGSYPVGHLSTMYWIGLKEGDAHLNISSPGWAKHAWSSFFAPWNAGAAIFVHKYARFSAASLLDALRKYRINTLCAPPTVWRMVILENLGARPEGLRELVSAGEPLNPEVIARVEKEWRLVIRDGYGQTETTLQVGNMPGLPVRVGSMGRPAPGYRLELLDLDGREAAEGELAVGLAPRPLGLMVNYADDPERTRSVMAGGYYRTGDTASRDEEGYFWFIGRTDDVFKSSDYRISPFEIESSLLECAPVAEAAVVPSPDPIRGFVPKAYVALKPGFKPDTTTAATIFETLRTKVAPFRRVRRLEFVTELPKTVSGKIRRVQLRSQEKTREAARPHEFSEESPKG